MIPSRWQIPPECWVCKDAHSRAPALKVKVKWEREVSRDKWQHYILSVLTEFYE